MNIGCARSVIQCCEDSGVERATDSAKSLGQRAVAEAVAHRKENTVIETIVVIVLALWLLGLVTSYTLGGFIHILLVIAIVAVLVRIIQGRNPLRG